MKIHEYQARQILADAGVPVPPAEVVRTPEEAAQAFKNFGVGMCVVKAQVYAGGRGKAGFVKLVKSADEARDAAKFMLTHRMVSYQTGPEGVPVSVLLVAPGVDIAKIGRASCRKECRYRWVPYREKKEYIHNAKDFPIFSR